MIPIKVVFPREFDSAFRVIKPLKITINLWRVVLISFMLIRLGHCPLRVKPIMYTLAHKPHVKCEIKSENLNSKLASSLKGRERRKTDPLYANDFILIMCSDHYASVESAPTMSCSCFYFIFTLQCLRHKLKLCFFCAKCNCTLVTEY